MPIYEEMPNLHINKIHTNYTKINHLLFLVRIFFKLLNASVGGEWVNLSRTQFRNLYQRTLKHAY